jgi:hypothetical protein
MWPKDRVDTPDGTSIALKVRAEATWPRWRLFVRSVSMLWTLLAIILILWLLGFTVANLGAFVHLLLIVALIVLIAQLLTGRRAV